MSRLILLAVVFAASCASRSTPVLVPQVQAGPSAQIPAKRVLALSASCGSVEFECPPEYVSVVDGIVRSSMDFAGYSIVDPATLRNDARERNEVREREVITRDSSSSTETERVLDFDTSTHSGSKSRTVKTKKVTYLSGAGFNDLSVTERKNVIADAGADSVLTVRIIVGAQVGVWAPNQQVEVMAKLVIDDNMAWASRCMASSNDFTSVEAALENAARCAIYGGTGR